MNRELSREFVDFFLSLLLFFPLRLFTGRATFIIRVDQSDAKINTKFIFLKKLN